MLRTQRKRQNNFVQYSSANSRRVPCNSALRTTLKLLRKKKKTSLPSVSDRKTSTGQLARRQISFDISPVFFSFTDSTLIRLRNNVHIYADNSRYWNNAIEIIIVSIGLYLLRFLPTCFTQVQRTLKTETKVVTSFLYSSCHGNERASSSVCDVAVASSLESVYIPPSTASDIHTPVGSSKHGHTGHFPFAENVDLYNHSPVRLRGVLLR
jgi:hypothetical protein